MTKFQNKTAMMEETFNPFETVDNSKMLRSNLEEIDNRDIRVKFKATEDPIHYVFDSFDNTPLKVLAQDFVKESFCDIISFVTNICK